MGEDTGCLAHVAFASSIKTFVKKQYYILNKSCAQCDAEACEHTMFCDFFSNS